MNRLIPYLIVGAGGFLGANARFVVGRWAAGRWGLSFPYGTVLINCTGCLVLGIFGALFLRAGLSDAWRLFVAVGFLGAYTTFSTFEYETFTLISEGEIIRASANVVVSLLLGFFSVVAGSLLVRLLLPARGG